MPTKVISEVVNNTESIPTARDDDDDVGACVGASPQSQFATRLDSAEHSLLVKSPVRADSCAAKQFDIEPVDVTKLSSGLPMTSPSGHKLQPPSQGNCSYKCEDVYASIRLYPHVDELLPMLVFSQSNTRQLELRIVQELHLVPLTSISHVVSSSGTAVYVMQ